MCSVCTFISLSVSQSHCLHTSPLHPTVSMPHPPLHPNPPPTPPPPPSSPLSHSPYFSESLFVDKCWFYPGTDAVTRGAAVPAAEAGNDAGSPAASCAGGAAASWLQCGWGGRGRQQLTQLICGLTVFPSGNQPVCVCVYYWSLDGLYLPVAISFCMRVWVLLSLDWLCLPVAIGFCVRVCVYYYLWTDCICQWQSAFACMFVCVLLSLDWLYLPVAVSLCVCVCGCVLLSLDWLYLPMAISLCICDVCVCVCVYLPIFGLTVFTSGDQPLCACVFYLSLDWLYSPGASK